MIIIKPIEITGYAKPVIFYSHVAAQLVRKVAVHQKIVSPGSFSEAQAGIGRFFTAFQTGAWKKVTVKETVYLTGQIATVGGFFVLGEMIGRKSVIGYNIPG